MKSVSRILPVFLVAFALAAQAEPEAPQSANPGPTTDNTVASETVSAAPVSNVLFGKVELRPTWASAAGTVGTKNAVELGYQFEPDLKLLYNQGINVDLYKKGTTDVGVSFPDARLELDINNFWRDGSRAWSTDFQPRLHLPTDSGLRRNGYVGAVKPQLNLNRRMSDSLAFQLSAAPTLQAYSAGSGISENLPTANPVFENTFELVTKYTFSSRLKFEMPLKFVQTRYRAVAQPVRFNDWWTFAVALKPELVYALSPKLAAGLAFETASLVSNDMGRLTVGEGFQKALTQFILVASI